MFHAYVEVGLHWVKYWKSFWKVYVIFSFDTSTLFPELQYWIQNLDFSLSVGCVYFLSFYILLSQLELVWVWSHICFKLEELAKLFWQHNYLHGDSDLNVTSPFYIVMMVKGQSYCTICNMFFSPRRSQAGSASLARKWYLRWETEKSPPYLICQLPLNYWCTSMKDFLLNCIKSGIFLQSKLLNFTTD